MQNLEFMIHFCFKGGMFWIKQSIGFGFVQQIDVEYPHTFSLAIQILPLPMLYGHGHTNMDTTR